MMINIFAIIFFFRFEKKQEIWLPLNEKTYRKYVENKKETDSVFIDFTAAWCFTCQFNKKWILENEEIKNKFTEKKLILLRADMTKKNIYLSNLLAKYERKSIPVYIFYNKDNAPIVLDFLSKDKLLKLLE